VADPVAPAGRALSPASRNQPARSQSTAAPYYDQPGGGVQYRIVRVVGGVDTDGSVQALLDAGFLGIPGVS